MPKYIFFDISKKNIDRYKNVLGGLSQLTDEKFSIEFVVNDVKNVDADVYISPANSYGWMDGGIDKIYTEIFPGIQQTVQEEITRYFNQRIYEFDRGKLGKPYLPVGHALIVHTNRMDKFLICAPTMTTPMNIIDQVENVCLAMDAILGITNKFKDSVCVAIPCMGTGVGGLDPDNSARMILKAFSKLFGKKLIK
jgi:O-acetyl-ADP-ribose deacetylase (regulator of RNase III)